MTAANNRCYTGITVKVASLKLGCAPGFFLRTLTPVRFAHKKMAPRGRCGAKLGG